MEHKLERYLRSQEVSEKRLVNRRRELAATSLLMLHQSLPASHADVQTGDAQGTEVQTEETHNDITQ